MGSLFSQLNETNNKSRISNLIIKMINLLTGYFPKSRRDCLKNRDYFKNQFSRSNNFDSLTFDEGIVGGTFKGEQYLLKIRPKNFIESHVYIDEIWEPQIVKLISSYLHVPNGAVLDIGSNIGAISIPLAKLHPETTFYLFEPHPFVFTDLCYNVKLNKLSNVDLYNKAISNTSNGSMQFYAQKNAVNFGLSSFKLNHDIGEYEIIEVTCATIDGVFAESSKSIQLIKIDTQGSELQVLLSASKTIRKHRPVILFEFESEYYTDAGEEEKTRRGLISFFESQGYEMFLVPTTDNYFPKINLSSYFRGDILAVPVKEMPVPVPASN